MGDKFLTRREFKTFERWQLRAEQERDQALKLQAKEYERRLEALNHESERLDRYLQSTVSETSFEDFKKLLEERVSALRKAEDQRMGGLILLRVLAGSGAVGLLISILNIIGLSFHG